MSSFDNWPSATSSLDDAPSRRIDPAAPDPWSYGVNPSNPYDLSTLMGQRLMADPPGTGPKMPFTDQGLSWKQFGSMVALGIVGAVILGLIF